MLLLGQSSQLLPSVTAEALVGLSGLVRGEAVAIGVILEGIEPIVFY